MDTKIMEAEAVRREWREVIDTVLAGSNVVVGIDNKPLVAVIHYEDYLALQEQIEDLQDVRLAEAADAEYLRDPSTAIPWEQAKADLRADGLLDDE
jgi:hypothetical protein